ncbi:MAG TPA: RagB/SusD family nutrient uptake outer membrane protein [Flavobacterium sp.]|nr:RagB/SusD family nutrient uptake outer membrane protein [Flavobacterium sp.]
MKNIVSTSRLKLSLLVLAISMTLFGCSDFLDKEPQDIFTDDNYWTSENNVKTYSWGFYDTFLGYGNGTGTTSEFYFHDALNFDDNLCHRTFTTFNTQANATNSNWNSYYTLIRRANLMLERVPTVPMDNAKKNHYLGVAKFFRAYTYYRLVQQFGDVPYMDQYYPQNDPNIYKPALTRDQVIDNAIKDLEEAIPLMLDVEDKNISVNKFTAYAVLSKVCLYEGTHRKYNLSQSGTSYLQKAKAAALAVITSTKYKLNADWKALYNSDDLLSNTEVILAKRYIKGTFMHSMQAYTNTSTSQNGLTKFAADSYVTVNGLPIGQSGNSQYLGDATISNVFTNRDLRFSKSFSTVDYGYSDKTLAGIYSNTGYVMQLYNNPAITGTDVTTTGQNYTDSAVFSYNEVLLNYAEACAELGTITNSDLDLSLNLLRTRAGIAKLTTDGTNASANAVVINDPQRTSTLETLTGVVNPIIWEIRRERRVELMSWTFIRQIDILRWKKGDYLDSAKNPDVFKGARVTALIGNTTAKTKVDANGYILPYVGVTRVFESPKHYLRAIPTNDIGLYKAEGVDLKQNPGW